MVFFLSHPAVFYVLLLVLSGIALFAVFSMGEEDRKTRKKQLDLMQEQAAHIVELEKTLEEVQKQAREESARSEEKAKAAETGLAARISGLETELQAVQGLKTAAQQLKAELAAKQDAYSQTVRAKEELEAKLRAAAEELDKAKKESALSNQMYNGLKGQYDELEERLSQIAVQAEQTPVPPRAPAPQSPVPPAAAAPEKSPDTSDAHAPGPQPAPAAGTPFSAFKIPNLRGTVKENGQTKPPSAGT